MLPGEEQLEQAREGLAGPSVKLMRTVAQAIKEDLGAVKDVLDIFVRTGMQDIDKLGPQLEMLKKIGDTLGVLGLEKARTQIQRETQELNAIVASNKAVDQAVLEKIAATLLDVEDTLDRELVRSVTPGDGEAPPEAAGDDIQHKHVTQAVMGECIVNLAKVKEAVIQLVDQPGDVRALEQAKPQLRGIVAGLLMLNKTKAVKVVERVGDVIAHAARAGRPAFKPEYLERLADAIVSVEYYMETVSAGRNDPWYMLENAERCLDLLEKLPVVKAARRGRAGAAGQRAAAAAPPPKPAPKPAAKRPSVMEVDEERSDPELVELFIEEAKEEIANIQRHLPAWTENLAELRGVDRAAPLVPHAQGQRPNGRRAADRRVLVEHREPAESADQPDARDDAADGRVRRRGGEGVAAADRAARARVAAEGRRASADEASRSVRRGRSRGREPDGPVAARAGARGAGRAGAGPAGMDPVLADIFVKEMRGHVEVIRKYLAAAETRPEPHLVEEPLYRACHTLLGSGRMAGFEPAMALAGPMAEHLRRHFDAGTGLTNAGLAALRAAAGGDRDDGRRRSSRAASIRWIPRCRR